MMTWARPTITVFAALICLPSAIGQPAPEPKVAQTLSDWKVRLQRFQSVRYTISGVIERVNDVELPPHLKDRVLPGPPDLKQKPLKYVLLIDIAKKRIRLEETEPVPSLARDKWVPRLRYTAYNGDVFQQALPRESNGRGPDEADVSISKGNLGDRQVAGCDLWPVFMAHGVVPTADSPLRVDRLPTEHEPDELRVRGTVAHAGRSCVVLRTDPTGTMPNISDEFWVDPDRQSAIARHIYYSGGSPTFRLDVEHTQTPHGWLPKKWTHTTTVEGKVMTIIRLTVDSVEVNPALREEDFTLPLKPGMIVTTYDYPESGKGLDTARPAKGKYRVGADGELESMEPQTGFTTTKGIQLPPERGPWRWLWWGIGAVCVLVVVLLIGARLRRAWTQPQ